MTEEEEEGCFGSTGSFQKEGGGVDQKKDPGWTFEKDETWKQRANQVCINDQKKRILRLMETEAENIAPPPSPLSSSPCPAPAPLPP